MKSIKISAVICTHNRARYLRNAIKSLVNQNLPKKLYEIIIIDNVSTDDTKKIVEEFSNVQNLRYIYEPVLGLSQARNTGWKNAKGKYIAYLDDDATADKQWLKKILKFFNATKSTPGCVGGKVDLVMRIPRPVWLSDQLLFCLSKLDISDKIITLNRTFYFLHGCNMAISKDALEVVNGFQTNLGRKGKFLLSAGEILLQKKLQKKGYSCFYNPDISIQHYVPNERLTKKWFLKRMYWEGISLARVQIHNENLSKRKRRSLAIKEYKKLLKIKKIKNYLIKTDDPKIFTQKCKIKKNIGYIVGLLGFYNHI